MEIIFLMLVVFCLYQRSEIKNLRNEIQVLKRKSEFVVKDNFAVDEPRPIPLASSGEPLSPDLMYPESSGYGVPETNNALFDWIKQDFMVKLGSFLILLALGWFVSYAFANDWIGPVGRIVLGLALGVVFMVIGVLRMQRFPNQGGIFTLLGASTILLTTYAAREMYDMFTPVSALVIMFMAVSLVAFVSVRHNSERLAIWGLILGAFSPMLTSAPAPEVSVIFPYLLVVVAGTLWVVWLTGWTRLTFISLLITYVHSLPFLSFRIENRDAAIMFSFLFVAIFFVANLVSLVRRRTEEKHLGIHALTALGTVIFLFSWIQTAADSEWRSLLYTAWALVFAVGSYVVFIATANHKAFYLYGGTAITLIGVATAVELSDHGHVIIAIAYALEITMLIIGASKVAKQDWLLARLSLLFIIPALMSLESIYSPLWRGSILHSHFALLIIMMFSLGAVGFLIKSLHTDKSSESVREIASMWLVVSLLYATLLVWKVPHALFSGDTGTMISLIVYTMMGIQMFVTGRSENINVVKIFGIIYITTVVLRLLLVEVWNMETEGRIITFFVVGVLFVSTAFIRKLYNHPDSQLPDQSQQQ